MTHQVANLGIVILCLRAAVAFSLNEESFANPAKPQVEMRSPSTRAESEPKAHPVQGKGLLDHLVKNTKANISLTSNYLFRGITQTENSAAIQAGLTYTSPFNVYGNIWSSNSKFAGTDIRWEIDPGIGFYKEFSNDFNIDLGLYRYIFPSYNIWNYNEWVGQINFKFLQSNFGYSSNVVNVKRKGIYYDAGINSELPAHFFSIEGLRILALLGRYELPKGFEDITGISYNTYVIALAKPFRQYNVAVFFSNTTEQDFYRHYGGPHWVCTVTVEL
ncbi:TorF family putative porin [Legionella jordanis]|uniref:Uncharacterized protein n=1 Tax=Legionella jordanis TaxID=456 RepID=A0A0W0VBD2_9GAMM|nr:TorF family putative porin [Legionella jordanis]KTD17407.1 bacterial protein of unknown function [Legionella jordanis]RMX01828.1 hypothetical protein EAW55_09990 [Legionella jordanis]RMX15492.1 hypothetical protein EAS68_12450 [Legionella jordanis]VEH11572.1 Bacterial protein of uncharacterised function (Gcw_chp) [Legionella jordanis]HAT8714646.1 hypothetical protein [Legionella jordanis]